MVPEIETPEAAQAQSVSASRARGIWRDLRDAVRGTSMDYTQGSLGRAILLLAVPMMLEMAMESTFAVVDIFFVSSLGACRGHGRLDGIDSHAGLCRRDR